MSKIFFEKFLTEIHNNRVIPWFYVTLFVNRT